MLFDFNFEAKFGIPSFMFIFVYVYVYYEIINGSVQPTDEVNTDKTYIHTNMYSSSAYE